MAARESVCRNVFKQEIIRNYDVTLDEFHAGFVDAISAHAFGLMNNTY